MIKYLCKRTYAKADVSHSLIFCVRDGSYYECHSFTFDRNTPFTPIYYVNVYGELGNMRRFQLDDFYSLFYTKQEERKFKLKKINGSNL